MNNIQDYTSKDAELLYQSNLDSISEAFCVDHYPVSNYMLEARRQIVSSGKIPENVSKVFKRRQQIKTIENACGIAILSAEGIEYGYEEAFERVKRIAEKHCIGVIHGFQGFTPYVLGNTQKAIEEAQDIIRAIVDSKIHTIIADGPDTWYCLTALYNEFGLNLPQNLKIINLTGYLYEKCSDTESEISGRKVFFHDARSAYYLCEVKPDEKIIMPDYSGPEELLGKGYVYEQPRTIIDSKNGIRLFSVWSRALSRSFGNDEGLALVYPNIAIKMAQRKIHELKSLSADYIIADSLATVIYMEKLGLHLSEKIKICWLPELL